MKPGNSISIKLIILLVPFLLISFGVLALLVAFKKDHADIWLFISIYGIVTTLVSVLLVAVTVRKYLGKPMERILEHINSCHEENFGLAFKGVDHGECAALAEGLNVVIARFAGFRRSLEETVSQRTVELERSAREIGRNAETLQAYNSELEQLISISNSCVSREEDLQQVLKQFVTAIRDELGYVSVELYCLYKYTRRLGRGATSDENLLLRDNGLLQDVMHNGVVLKEMDRTGQTVIFLPITMSGRANQPQVEIESAERKGNSPSNWGVLVAVAAADPPDHAINILKLAGMELVHLSEVYELLRYERNMVDCLGQIHSISMSALAAADIPQLFTILKESEIIRRLFDGLALCVYQGGKGASPLICLCTDNVPEFDIRKFPHENITDEPVIFYDFGMNGCHSLILCPLVKGEMFFGFIGFFKCYQRLLRTEERAAAQLISQQVSYNIESISLHKNLAEQNLELKYEKEFSEKIFDCINSGILVVDENGRVLTANPYALTTLELSSEELAGSDLETVIPGLLAAASTNQREGIFEIGPQKTVYLGFSMSRLQGTDSLSGMIILFRDITEITTLRKELRRKEYFSTIGEMASWIAHEVRNPLFAIASITRILQKQAKDKEQALFIESILKETQSLNLLVDDLLMYGKPLELKLVTVKVQDFLDEIVEGMSSFASESGGSISITSENRDICIAIDKNRVKQVFYNLIKNSLEAGAGIVAMDYSASGEMIRICVRDNGKGIKPADIAKMFTPFFTTKKSGTGLGLPVCRKIIEEHGGTIDISSGSQQGAEVVIKFKRMDCGP